MSWIPSYQELGTHPKLKKFARLLEIPLPLAVGHLHYLWWWAMDYASDGDLSRWEPADIAEAAQWQGDPGNFLQALCECGSAKRAGFIERTEESGLRFHDWEQYGGKVIREREDDAERKRREREARKASGGRPADVPGSPRMSSVDKSRVEIVEENRIDKTRKDKSRVDIAPPAANATSLPTRLRTDGDGDNWQGLSVIDIYERATALPVVPMDVDTIGAMIADYGEQTVIDAIKEARGTGRWTGGTKYLQSILQRWEREGRDKQKPQPTPMAPQRPRNVDDDLNRRYRNLMPEGVK